MTSGCAVKSDVLTDNDHHVSGWDSDDGRGGVGDGICVRRETTDSVANALHTPPLSLTHTHMHTCAQINVPTSPHTHAHSHTNTCTLAQK